MEMNYSEGIENILDDFLKELLIHPILFEGQRDGYVSDQHYLKKFKLTDTDLNELIDYTRSDGHIHHLTSPLKDHSGIVKNIQVSISLKGKMFLQKGGYVKRAIDISRETAMHDRNENLLSTYTIVLAIGTLGLVVVEVLIHRHELLSLFCCCGY